MIPEVVAVVFEVVFVGEGGAGSSGQSLEMEEEQMDDKSKEEE